MNQQTHLLLKTLNAQSVCVIIFFWGEGGGWLYGLGILMEGVGVGECGFINSLYKLKVYEL